MYYQELERQKEEKRGQKKRNCVPSRQHQATHIDSDLPEAPEASLRCSFASTLYTVIDT